MGAIAAQLADRVVVTSDNPRSEAPDAIIGADPARPRPADEVDVQSRTGRAPSPKRWRRPRRPTWCCWPARAMRTTGNRRHSAAVLGPGTRRAARWQAAAPGWPHECHDDAAAGSPLAGPAPTLVGDAQRGASARAHRHAHPGSRRPVRGAARRALRCQRLSGRGARQGRGGGAGRARRWPQAGLPGLEVADAKQALAQLATALARAVHAAADRRDRQQRQDHGDADDRHHPARLPTARPPSPRRATSTTTSACR